MEPAFCLSIWQGRLQGTGAGELGNPGAKAPACRGRRAARLPGLGTWQLPRSRGLQAAGRLWEQGSPGPKEQEAERDTVWPPTLGIAMELGSP